jgi:hypothetical protein
MLKRFPIPYLYILFPDKRKNKNSKLKGRHDF